MGTPVPTLDAFIQAVQSGDAITTTSSGHFYSRWTITRLFYEFMGWKIYDEIALAEYYSTFLHSLELSSHAIKTLSTNGLSNEKLEAATRAIRSRLQEYINQEQTRIHAIENVKELLLRRRTQQLHTVYQDALRTQQAIRDIDEQLSQVEEALKSAKKAAIATYAMGSIDRALLARTYRISSQKDLTQNTPRTYTEDVLWFKRVCVEWKKEQSPSMSLTLSDTDIQKIERSCRYPEIISQLKTDPIFFVEYCKFLFRNAEDAWVESVDTACQFPGITQDLVDGYLEKRGRELKNKQIIFEEQETPEGKKKIVSLKVEGSYYSLHDRNKRVTFDDGASYTIQEIIDTFVQKNDDMGELECLQKGVAHIQPKNLSIDYNDPKWFLKLPVFTSIPIAEAKETYSIPDTIVEGQGFIAAAASRQEKGLSAGGNHSWIIIGYPDPDRPGNLRIYPFGKFSSPYPKGKIDEFLFSFKTKQGFVAYPDENSFHTHREKIYWPKVTDLTHLQRTFDKIRSDLKKSKEGTFIFQAQGNNCTYFVQDCLDATFPEEQLPRLFDVDLYNVKTPTPVNYFMDFLRFISTHISKKFGNWVRVSIGCLAGASDCYTVTDTQGTVIVEENLLKNKKWSEDHRIGLPAQLFLLLGRARQSMHPQPARIGVPT